MTQPRCVVAICHVIATHKSIVDIPAGKRIDYYCSVHANIREINGWKVEPLTTMICQELEEERKYRANKKRKPISYDDILDMHKHLPTTSSKESKSC